MFPRISSKLANAHDLPDYSACVPDKLQTQTHYKACQSLAANALLSQANSGLQHFVCLIRKFRVSSGSLALAWLGLQIGLPGAARCGCDFQVGYEGANMSTGIGPSAQLPDKSSAEVAGQAQGLSGEAAVRALGKAEADSRLRLLQAANSRHSRSLDKDDLQEMGLL